MWSLWVFDCSVSIGAFDLGMSRLSSFFYHHTCYYFHIRENLLGCSECKENLDKLGKSVSLSKKGIPKCNGTRFQKEWASPISMFDTCILYFLWNLNHRGDWSRIVHQFRNILNYFVLLRITDNGSVPEMRIWSILLIKSDLKWCLHLRKLYFYFSFVSAAVVWNLDYPG